MKKIPETFELDQDDIKEAITEWLNEHHTDESYLYDFDIQFKVTQEQTPGKGMAGGMNDPIITTVISAVAAKDV